MDEHQLKQLYDLVTFACTTALTAKAEATALRSLLAQSGIVIDNAAFDEAFNAAFEDEMADMPVGSELLGEVAMEFFGLSGEEIDDASPVPPISFHADEPGVQAPSESDDSELSGLSLAS